MPQPKCRILCIDDHEDTSEMLKLLLAQEDYEVKTALSVREAVALATSQEFDLYVFDKHLPDGNGLELRTKLNAVTPGVPCIVYTGDAYEQIARDQVAFLSRVVPVANTPSSSLAASSMLARESN